MQSEPTYRYIAGKLAAIANCEKSGNTEWAVRHTTDIDQLIRNTAPSGSGIDNGTTLADRSTAEKLVFNTSFHHMNENGYYDGWTEHTVTVRASLQFGIDITIGGRDRNDIKEYLADVFHGWLTSEACVNA